MADDPRHAAGPSHRRRGQPDRRSPGQRRHDALLDAGRRLLRAGTLPDAGGTPATVLITLTLDQLETRTGLATTAHGGRHQRPGRRCGSPPKPTSCRSCWATPAAVLQLGRTRRTASTAQRLRPGRPRPGLFLPGLRPAPGLVRNPPRDPWVDGGRTDLDNLTLVCGFHHREHHKRGWTVPHDQRLTALATTPLDRPHPNPPPQHHPPHPPAPQPAPSTRTDLTVDASADDSEIGQTSELTRDSTGATRRQRDQASGRRQTKAVRSRRREIVMSPHTEAGPAAGHGLPVRPRHLAS